MYSNYFGLDEPPFSIAPNPRYLYLSKQHREALAHRLYGISSNGGFVLLTGEVGTGKTTVCRGLLEQLPDTTDVALILNPQYTAQELLAAMCDELHITHPEVGPGTKSYVDAINQHLLQSHAQGRNTVLIIDEAQNLGIDVLEQIRLLTNLETDNSKLLQIILVGQPELLEKLSQPEMRQVMQRITARFHLGALSRHELESYVAHRLSVAGVQGRLFPVATLNRLYSMTKGVPRLINIVCDRALLGAFVERHTRVEVPVLNKAAVEVFGDKQGFSGWGLERLNWRSASALVLVILLLMAVFVKPVNALVWHWFDSVAQLQLLTQESQAGSIFNQEYGGAVSNKGGETKRTAINRLQTAAYTRNPVSLGDFSWADNKELQLNQVIAYRTLFDSWGVDYRPKENPIVCKYAQRLGYACLFGRGDIESLMRLNRPAVLKLFNARGDTFYAALVAVNGDKAELLIDGQKSEATLTELSQWWFKTYTLFWRPPPYYDGIMNPGAQNQNVAWLEQKLAAIQGRQPRPENNTTYNPALVMQVKQFQQSRGYLPMEKLAQKQPFILMPPPDRELPC